MFYSIYNKTIEPIDTLPKEDLRRFLYWATSTEINKAKTLCKEIKGWFDNENLLEIDNQCGAVKKEKLDISKNKHELGIEDFVTIQLKNDILIKLDEKILKKITNLLNQWFNKKTIDLNAQDWYICKYNEKIILLFSIIKFNNIRYLYNLVLTGTRKKINIDYNALKSVMNTFNIKSIYINNTEYINDSAIKYYTDVGLKINKQNNISILSFL